MVNTSKRVLPFFVRHISKTQLLATLLKTLLFSTQLFEKLCGHNDRRTIKRFETDDAILYYQICFITPAPIDYAEFHQIITFFVVGKREKLTPVGLIIERIIV